MERNKKKIWLSHSGIDVLYRCPRCFWLRYNKGIYQPEGIVSRLANRFDIVIKDYFDKFRAKGELPPMIQGKISGKLESPFQEKYFYSIDENYGFWGKLDECFISSDGLYIPVDFKTSSSDPTQRRTFPAYQNQLDEYSLLMEKNNKKTAKIGYLIYFYPEYGNELHKGFPMTVHIETLTTNPDSVMERIKQAIEVIEGSMPEPSEKCPFCSWYNNITDVLK